MGPTSTETASSNPGEHAIDGLSKQLTREHLDTAPSAIRAMVKAAVSSEDPFISIKAISELGKFMAIPLTADTNFRDLKSVQIRASEGVAAISFASGDPRVQKRAIQDLSNGLKQPDIEEHGYHRNLVQLIMIIGKTSDSNQVKNQAIDSLTEYSAMTDSWGGYQGRSVLPKVQNYANTATGVVAKPEASNQAQQTPAQESPLAPPPALRAVV